jgi:beta-fructofuranosidase
LVYGGWFKKEGIGKAILYISEDLENWTYKGVAAESDGSQGDMWECPDLFPLKNHHVLIVSPMYGKDNEKPIYIIGDMDYENGVFTQETYETLDYGFDFYAPQTMLDVEGRRIVIGWMEKWLTKMPSQEHGWAGAMSIPRELVLKGNSILKQRPVEELSNLRTDYKRLDPFNLEKTTIIKEHQGQVSETIIDFNIIETEADQFGVQLRCSEGGTERTEILLDLKMKEILMDRTFSGCGEKGVSKAPLVVREDGNLTLRIFMDTTSVEVFVNEGEQVITNRIFPNDSSNLFKIFTNGGKVIVNRFESWKLSSVWE